MKKYKEFNGMNFSENTPNDVCKILHNAYENKYRIRVFYGDAESGKSWNDEYDTCGYIGKSTGTEKIPLLLNNNASKGGCAILDDKILKIVDVRTKSILYQHPNYKRDFFFCLYKAGSSDEAIVCINEESNVYANCKTMKQALRLCDFMNGLKHSK
jgi:hypothetical protein